MYNYKQLQITCMWKWQFQLFGKLSSIRRISHREGAIKGGDKIILD